MTNSVLKNAYHRHIDGKTALHTEISSGEARKVKHTAYILNGMRCIAGLPGTLGMM